MIRALLILGIAALPIPAAATWSIVAVDAKTGEVGSAGASCTANVAGIARLIPGKGAIVAQAASNMAAKELGAALIAQGKAARHVIAVISAKSFDPHAAHQQYGVAVLDNRVTPSTAAYTGTMTAVSTGHRLGPDVAVQGNILVHEQVFDSVMSAFERARRAGEPLSARLMAALNAGSIAGGDARCGAKTAQSAYLGVAQKNDPADRPSLRIIVTTDRTDSSNPVQMVAARLAAMKD